MTGVAVGGEGVARESSGRVVFVAGGLPGELVEAEMVDEHAAPRPGGGPVEVVEPSADRVAPPCPFVAAGCGGCGWQHVDLRGPARPEGGDGGRRPARAWVGSPTPRVGAGPALVAGRRRLPHDVRAVADADGRLALRRHHSHDLVAVPGCLVAHPLVAEVLAEGRFPPGAEVTVRVGARTGERMVVVDGGAQDAGRRRRAATASSSPRAYGW